MKKKLLLSALIAGAILVGNSNQSFAADNASQTVTATLGLLKKVTATGTALSANIDPDSGDLDAAMTPAFQIQTNRATNQNMYLKGECVDDSGTVNAITGTGATGGTYITLTNAAVIPTNTAVIDAQGTPTDPDNNPNVILYGINAPANVGTDLVYTWVGAQNRWNAVLAKKGKTDTSITIPKGSPKANTFNEQDEEGGYQATITLSFV